MRRFDVYGFRSARLDEAAALIERVLGVPMKRRDSSYRGLYYSGGLSAGHDYLLESNDEGARWHREFGTYGATLMVSDQPGMDAIRDQLTAGRDDPVLLRSIVHEDDVSEEPSEDEDVDDEDTKS